MAELMVVDDEQAICWAIDKLGSSLGHRVTQTSSAEEALRVARSVLPDVVILDVRLPGMDGLSAIPMFRELLPSARIIVMTAFGELETAVQAVRSGVFDYVLKPFHLEEMRSAIRRSTQPVASRAAMSPAGMASMVGASPAMQSLFKRIALAADSEANVHIRGESGVGKELAAHAIHRYSTRESAPYVAVNIAALNPSLAESELFGHVAGAFTGASQSRVGLLAQAHGGTLFLDEIAEIPLALQVKLLRAIDQGEVLPVGADRPVATRFRVISATHQDLARRVREGLFRQDLYYRVCAFEIEIPPLRERVEDIPTLAFHFASQWNGGSLQFSDETLDLLKRRPWCGNVRELRNAIEHASVLARSGVVLPEHLPPAQFSWDAGLDADGSLPSPLEAASEIRSQQLLDDPHAYGSIHDRLLQEAEGPLLKMAMERFDHEFAPAARALGLHRTTLKKKWQRYDTLP